MFIPMFYENQTIHYSSHSPGILLLTLSLLPGIRCPFPNAPLSLTFRDPGQMPPPSQVCWQSARNDVSLVVSTVRYLTPIAFPPPCVSYWCPGNNLFLSVWRVGSCLSLHLQFLAERLAQITAEQIFNE